MSQWFAYFLYIYPSSIFCYIFSVLYYFNHNFCSPPAPVVVAVQVNGSGYASDIFRDIAASFDILQKGNITVLSKKCLMNPLEPDYMRYLLIGTTTSTIRHNTLYMQSIVLEWLLVVNTGTADGTFDQSKQFNLFTHKCAFDMSILNVFRLILLKLELESNGCFSESLNLSLL